MKKIFGPFISFFTLATPFISLAQTLPDLPVTELPIQGQPEDGVNPIRQGIDAVQNNLEGNFATSTDPDFSSSLETVLAQINVIINYFLGLLALIALVYIIYHGFVMLFAVGKDDQLTKGREGVKTAGVALIGIGLSWIIVRFVFYIIGIIA